MNIEEANDNLIMLKYFLQEEGDENWEKYCEAIDTLLTAYEKEKNKELESYCNDMRKEINEENKRCMLLAVENQDLKEKNKELNILRLQLLISQFPDTTETYKKYKKELDELLKEE